MRLQLLLYKQPHEAANVRYTANMVVHMQGLVLLLASASIVSAFQFYKAPPPASNGCFRGRSDGSINVQAVFDQGGVRGYVQFYQPARGEPTQINVNLQGLDQFGGFYPWHAHEFPVRNALLNDFPCSNDEVGGHYDPFGAFNNAEEYNMNCNPGNQSACEVGDFSGKLGRLRNDQSFQQFMDPLLDLYSPQSIVGRSLVIHYPYAPLDRWICANIEPVGCRVKNLRAAFNNSVLQGEVVIRHVAGQDSAKIFVDLYQISGNLTDRSKDWSLHFGQPSTDNVCDGVRDQIAGESDHNSPSCSMQNHRLCRFGDLTTKCGPLPLMGGRMRLCCTDIQLGLIPFSVFYQPQNNHFMSVRIGDQGATMPDGCARLDKVIPQLAKAKFSGKDIIGTVVFYQSSPLDRTFIQPSIESVRQRNISLIIRDGMVMDPKNCTEEALGPIFSTPGDPVFSRPLPSSGIKTGDAFLLGNLGSAIPIAQGSQRVVRRSSTQYVPLFGPNTIIGHSLVVVQNIPGDDPVPLACGTITRNSNYPSGDFASFTGYQNLNG